MNDCLIPAGNPAAGTAAFAAMGVVFKIVAVTDSGGFSLMPRYAGATLGVPTFPPAATPIELMVATEGVAAIQPEGLRCWERSSSRKAESRWSRSAHWCR